MKTFYRLVRFFAIVFCFQLSYSQVEKTINSNGKKQKITFRQFDFSLPFEVNDTYGDVDDNGRRSNYWFVPVGITTGFGYGIHYKNILGLSANTGLVFNGSEKLVAVPVYGNLRISPAIGGDSRLTVQYGVGKSFALGRGNLSGVYQKIALGIENEDDLLFFVSFEAHGFATRLSEKQIATVSLGISVLRF